MRHRRTPSRVTAPGGVLTWIIAWALLGTGPDTALRAQSQKEVPPVLPFVPPDSARTAGERPQWELPEVLVYGRDTSLRLPGQKLAIGGKPAIAYRPQEQRETIPSTMVSAAPQELLAESGPQARSLLLRAEGGSYWTANVAALYRGARRRMNYGADISFRRSDGAVENGQYAILDLGGRVTYPFSPRGAVHAHVDINQAGYGLAGATPPDTARALKAERHASAVSLGTGLELGLGDRGQLTVAYEYATLRSSDDTLGVRLSRVSDGLHRLDTRVVFPFGSIELLANISYLSEGYRPQGARGTQQSSLVQAEWGVAGEVLARGHAYLGLGFHGVSSAAGGQSSALSIAGRFWIAPSPRLGLTVEFRRGYDCSTLMERRAENPYHAPHLLLQPVLTKFALAVGAEWRVASQLVLEARVGRSWMKDQWYWQRDPASGLFTVGVVPDVKMNHAALVVRGEPAANLSIEARYALYSDSFRLAQVPGAADLPYLAHRRVPLSAAYRLGERTRLQLRSDLMSSRTADLVRQAKLKPYALLSCAVTHQLNRRVSLFVQGENLTNRSYERWQGYPEMGLTIQAGGFATW
ncbi:MAG: TonB-dependent receptor [candidate division KSB1 bacterium]|nr:TonB-dependent receptor [candidate division KSB1 bacterium]